MVEEVATTEPKIKEKLFRLKEEEDAKLPKLIEFAYRAGYLKKPSFQEFMVFCINTPTLRTNMRREREGLDIKALAGI